ncbi:MAG: tetratricopeptide repeat protein [Chlamydiota bacterium]|nr:tetratricopeptide repeat protein [Chlamydiota bacterium]
MKTLIRNILIGCFGLICLSVFAQEHIPDPIETDPDFEQAYELYNRGEYNEAIGLFQKVLERDPEHLRSQVYLGVCYMGLESWDKAIEELEKALKMDEKYPLSNYALSVCNARKPEPNIENAKKYLALAKENGYHVPVWFEEFLDRLATGRLPAQNEPSPEPAESAS